MAYITPTRDIITPLQEIRTKIQKKYKVAVTTGYGPRFLHSTGQLHKGDGGNGLFIQLTESMPNDVPIPNEPGGIKELETFLDVSNVKIFNPVTKKGDRIGYRFLDNGKKVRYFKSTGEVV